MTEEQHPSIDGYYRELHITLVSPYGDDLKTVVMPIDDLMPEHASWRNAAVPYRMRVEYIMNGGSNYIQLHATAFWNQAIE